MFTDKAKELFEKWYLKPKRFKRNALANFYKLPLPKQIGVIEDFAESLGYLIDKINYGNRVDVKIYKKDMSIIQVIRIKNTEEARQEVIKQLNDLINGGNRKS